MGGAADLKGTDGIETLKKAVELGANPLSPEKAKVFLIEKIPSISEAIARRIHKKLHS